MRLTEIIKQTNTNNSNGLAVKIERIYTKSQCLSEINHNRKLLILKAAAVAKCDLIQIGNKFYDLNFNEINYKAEKGDLNLKIYQVDDNLYQIFENLAIWTLQERIENSGIDPSKSIALVGNIGVGKTVLIKALCELYKNTQLSFRLLSSLDIAEKAMTMANFVADNYGYPTSIDQKNIAIDDIGVEQIKVSYYGNEITPIATLLSHRYNKWQSLGLHTHITTNLTLEEIAINYGERVADRFVEMYNVFYIIGQSKRK